MADANNSRCFVCSKEIPFSPRYPERLCEDCVNLAVNGKGEKLSFHNESMSGGFVSYNGSARSDGREHTCYVKGYECHADEAYMGGIVVVPTAAGKQKKIEKQTRNRKVRNASIFISGILAPAAIWGAYQVSKDGYFNEGFTLFDALIIVGSICLLLFIGLILYRSWILLGLAGLLYLATGYYTEYFYGYRSDAFFDAVAIAGVVSGALVINTLLFNTGYINKKMKAFQGRRQTGNAFWLLLVIIPLLLIIAGYIVLTVKGGERAEEMLDTAPSGNTTAIVREVREYKTSSRHNRNNLHNDALLQYTVSGKTMYRMLDNKTSQYTTGMNLEIKYVVADPYIIRVLRQRE